MISSSTAGPSSNLATSSPCAQVVAACPPKPDLGEPVEEASFATCRNYLKLLQFFEVQPTYEISSIPCVFLDIDKYHDSNFLNSLTISDHSLADSNGAS